MPNPTQPTSHSSSPLTDRQQEVERVKQENREKLDRAAIRPEPPKPDNGPKQKATSPESVDRTRATSPAHRAWKVRFPSGATEIMTEEQWKIVQNRRGGHRIDDAGNELPDDV